MEPSGAPPIPDGPVGVGGIYDGGKDSQSGEELGSDSFWNSLSELSIFGTTVTPDQARRLIYSIGAVLLMLALLLVSYLLSGGSGSSGGHSGTDASASARINATGSAAAPPPTLGHAPIGFTAKLTAEDAEFGGAQFIVYGTECSLAPPSPSACGGVQEARCGLTQDGALYAWLGATCDGDPQCEGAGASDSDAAPMRPSSVRRGPPARHGCSRTSDEADGTFVECCVALPSAVKTTRNCPAAIPSCDRDGDSAGGGR